MKTLKKDYFISKRANVLIISKNPNSSFQTFEEMEDITKRYLYKIGDKIVTSFGVETIKAIDKNYGTQHGHEWLITVEENENQYKPCELIGIHVKSFYSCELSIP